MFGKDELLGCEKLSSPLRGDKGGGGVPAHRSFLSTHRWTRSRHSANRLHTLHFQTSPSSTPLESSVYRMREGTTLRSLLTVAREPSQSQYVKVSDSVLLRPEQIATLIDDGAINQASMLSSSQYARLQRLFTRLDGQRQVKVGSSKQQVNIQLLADSVAKLLLHIISSHQLNSNEDDIARLIDISMPLLFQAQALKPRQTFFFLLPKNIKIIKKLVCNASGRSAVGSIFHSQCFIADPPAIHAWAHSLTALAIGCGEDHDAKVLIDKFENLKLAIHDLSCLHDERQNIISDSFPDLSSDQDLIGCLQSWSLKLPISDTTLDSLLTDLRRHKMLDILKSNLPTFPCPRCHIDQPEDLKASMDGEWNNSHNEETDDRGEFVHFLAESDDIWKVSMSGTARKSMHDQGGQ